MKIINAYSRLLRKNPYRTKMISSSIIFGLSDYICQRYIEKKQSINWLRVCKLSSIGGLFIAPSLHIYFETVLPVFNN